MKHLVAHKIVDGWYVCYIDVVFFFIIFYCRDKWCAIQITFIWNPVPSHSHLLLLFQAPLGQHHLAFPALTPHLHPEGFWLFPWPPAWLLEGSCHCQQPLACIDCSASSREVLVCLSSSVLFVLKCCSLFLDLVWILNSLMISKDANYTQLYKTIILLVCDCFTTNQ